LIREHPLENAFVSLQDPKPPLHFWLLALFLPLSSDPVLAGRLLSVAAGAASVPLFFGLARAILRRLGTDAPEWAALAGSVFFVCSPFFAFYQRMTLAESLFTLETLLVAWLSLRLVEASLDDTPGFGRAVGLGVAMGAAMLTRQDFSYALWALPPLMWCAFQARSQRNGRMFLVSFFTSGLVALLVWAPMLFAKIGPDWKTRIFHVGHYREPISVAQRGRNALEVFGWFATYMTPPVLAVAFLGLLWMIASKNRRAALLLGGWFALVAGPILLFASLFFPRYFLGGVLPLLILAGWTAGEIAAALRNKGVSTPWVAAALVFLLCLWPAREIARSWTDWKSQTLVPVDRWQYVTGWPAGAATEAAARFTAERARSRPILLLTPEISGNPTDGLWVLLRHREGIALRGTPESIDRPILVESRQAPGRFLLRGDIREMKQPRYEPVPPGAEVDFVCPDPVTTRQGSFATESYLRERNPSLRLLARFENPRDAGGPLASAVLVFQLR
jgi:4-amino-4-deoxy-L-arabinose transferase-like glycosyltransferase